jgi:cysteine desulfurase
MKEIYLDYAAATPLAPEVLAAMQPYFADKFYNPSALYGASRGIARDIADARAGIAHWFGARPTEIIFTAGGTESDNLAIHGIMRRFPNAKVLVSSIEHEAVLAPAGEYRHELIPVLTDGTIDLAALEKMIDNDTVLISVMYANNEIGTIEPIRQVSQLIKKVRESRLASKQDLPLYLHTDACQAAAYLDLHASRLGVDLMTINGGKIYGPKQSGVLFVKAGIELAPQILGGGQEQNLRSGTENVPAIMGLRAALDLVQGRRQNEGMRLERLRQHFMDEIFQKIPDAIINGSLKSRLPNNIHLSLPGYDNERLLIQLDEQGICAAAGSACSASNQDPSHVLRAIGLSDEIAQSSLRFTMGADTTKADVTHAVELLKNCL